MEEGRQNRMISAEVFQATNSTGDSSLSEKDSNSSILEVTIETNTIPTRKYGMKPEVFEAAATGNLSFFEGDSNSNLHEVTLEGNTVLHVALQFKKFEVAEKILKNNLSPSLALRTNTKGNTPLHVAAMVGASSLVKILIDKAKDERDVEADGQQLLSMKNHDGDTALHIAVRYGNFEAVRELINEKDPAELAMKVNNAGESALFLAVDRQEYGVASHILSAAPDCSYAGRHGMNVLHALVLHTSSYSNKGNLFVQVHKKIKRVVSRFGRYLITFVWVINMLFLIPIPNFIETTKILDKIQEFLLSGAFGTIPKGFVRKVMEKCPSAIEQYDDSGWTPLHIAAHMGNWKFVGLLLENGSTPAYVKNIEGLSALHIAAKEMRPGGFKVMRILLKACPEMYEWLDNKGRNVLHAAVESGGWPGITFFKKRPEFEVLVNEKDGDGNTPTHLATIIGYLPTSLLTTKVRGVHLNATNKEGFTPLDNVLFREKLNSWKETILRKKGARPSLRGALIKMGIQNSNPRSKPMAGDGDGDDKGKSQSDFWKRVSKTNMLVATLIATVSFMAAFTVPGGYNQNESVHEGMAILRKKSAFCVFLIANTLAFGLSSTSVFLHFLASATVKDVAFHKKVARCTSFLTNWSIGTLLVAFIAGTYSVVPHSLGISVAVLLCCCFLSSVFFPLSI